MKTAEINILFIIAIIEYKIFHNIAEFCFT